MKAKSLRRLVAIALATPAFAQAGGLYLYEIGTSDMGFAGAGTAARAEDASTVYGNPAGMTRLNGNQMTLGAQALYGKTDYSVNDQSAAQQAFGGGSPDNVVGWMPGGSAFYSHSINNDLKVGFAAYGNFGLKLDFGDDWAGRGIVTEATMMGMTLQPTVAYRLNEKWSIGAGLTANYGLLRIEHKRLDGSTHDEKDTDWEFGGRVGVMFEPSASTRVGVVWTSKVEYDMKLDTRFSKLLGRSYSIPLDVYAPQQLMISTYQKLSDRWSMTGNLGWQDWSSFSSVAPETVAGVPTGKLRLQDTWHMALGAQYQYSATTRINAGIAYDSSFYKNNNRATFSMPAGDAWRFGLGAQYTLSPQSEIGVAAEYLHAASLRDPSTLIGGKYDDPYMVFLSAQYSYKF